jgi:hypothetical protein
VVVLISSLAVSLFLLEDSVSEIGTDTIMRPLVRCCGQSVLMKPR